MIFKSDSQHRPTPRSVQIPLTFGKKHGMLNMDLPDPHNPKEGDHMTLHAGRCLMVLLFVFGALGGCSSGHSVVYLDGDRSELEADFEAEADEAADSDTKDNDSEAPSPDGDAEPDTEAERDAETETDADDEAAACAAALPLACGARLDHSTAIQGRENLWRAYSCTARLESGRETLYSLQLTSTCAVTLRLSQLTEDLDILVLKTCSPWDCIQAASTPLDIQDSGETLNFVAQADTPYVVAIDGYNQDQGSYTLAVECACPL